MPDVVLPLSNSRMPPDETGTAAWTDRKADIGATGGDGDLAAAHDRRPTEAAAIISAPPLIRRGRRKLRLRAHAPLRGYLRSATGKTVTLPPRSTLLLERPKISTRLPERRRRRSAWLPAR